MTQRSRDVSLLEATLDSVTEAVLAIDRERRIICFNARYAEMWRVPASVRPGDSTDPVVDHMKAQTVDPSGFRARVEELRAQPLAQGEDELVLADGRVIERSSRPILLGDEETPIGRIICYRDVTAAREASALLRRSEAQLRKLFEAAPDGIAVSSSKRLVFANRAFAALLGHETPDAVVGAALETILAPDEWNDVVERVEAVYSGTTPASLRERRFRRADGSLVHVEVAALPVTFDESRAMLLVARDMTERKRLQAQLLLADRMASLGALTAGLAHEINNPIGYVTGNLDVIGRRLAEVARDLADLQKDRPELGLELTLSRLEDALEMQRTATEGCRRVRMIAGDLRTFSRTDEGTSRLVDVRWPLDAALNIARSEIEKRARLVKDYGEVPLVKANESRLGQVFLNLLVNAVQAIVAGAPERNEVRITTKSSAEGRAVVQISDTGPGIPADALARVFEPFFTTKPPGQATGLGLSICQRIVAELGGTIDVFSTAERGTTFQVTL